MDHRDTCGESQLEQSSGHIIRAREGSHSEQFLHTILEFIFGPGTKAWTL